MDLLQKELMTKMSGANATSPLSKAAEDIRMKPITDEELEGFGREGIKLPDILPDISFREVKDVDGKVKTIPFFGVKGRF